MKISVVRKVKIAERWRFLPVWKLPDGKMDWSRLKHEGQPVTSTEGTFYLDYTEAGKRIRRAVGDHQRDAKIALANQTGVVTLRRTGMAVDDAPQIQAYRPISGRRISEIVAEFHTHPPLKLRKKSRAKYGNALRSFAKWTEKTHLSQLTRTDINRFMSHMVDREGLDPSTAFDKAVIVQAVMNEHGATIRMNRGDWPKVTERQPEVYQPHVLQKLFATADRDEYTLFQTFLMSGFRDQEVGFLSWDDFSARHSTLTVSKKTHMGFDPKSYHERTIPIPDELVRILELHQKTQDGSPYLIFPTSGHNTTQGRPGGQRDRHMLDRLKRLAHRAGLNCGRCDGTYRNVVTSCGKHPICTKFGLHRFRHTYATTLLRDGVDLVSLQKLLGHADMESTRKYLRALEPADLLTKIRGTSIATRFV